MDNAGGGPVLQSKNRISEVINQFGRSQQILDQDRTHFQRDRHSGLNVTSYLSNSPDSIRYQRNQKQNQFKSFHKKPAQNKSILNVGDEGYGKSFFDSRSKPMDTQSVQSNV